MKEAKDKAMELTKKFYFAEDENGYHSMNKHRANQCAIIAHTERPPTTTALNIFYLQE